MSVSVFVSVLVSMLVFVPVSVSVLVPVSVSMLVFVPVSVSLPVSVYCSRARAVASRQPAADGRRWPRSAISRRPEPACGAGRPSDRWRGHVRPAAEQDLRQTQRHSSCRKVPQRIPEQSECKRRPRCRSVLKSKHHGLDNGNLNSVAVF